MKHFFKLIRYKNLLIIAATQYALLYCLVSPNLTYNYSLMVGSMLSLQFSSVHFFLMVLASMCISAGGYIINDYFDMNIDSLNRPDDVIVGKHISSNVVMVLYWILTLIGVALGFYISMQIDLFNAGFIFVVVAGLLWFYASIFNNELIVGNLIVAVLAAIVPLLVIIYEIIPLNYAYLDILKAHYIHFNTIIYWTLAYSFLAFLSTVIREIIKDIEDLEGDRAYGRKSIPIMWGIKNTKVIVATLILIFIAVLTWATVNFIESIYAQLYILLTIICPSIYMLYHLIRSNRESDYTFLSKLSKIIMLFGIAFLIILYFITKGIL